VLAGSAAVIISYDVADWSPSPAAIAAAVLNSGVLVIDRPVVLINDTNFNGTSALIDVSRYNSVDCVFDSNGFPGPFSVEVNWYADAAATQRVFSTTVFLNEGPTQWAGAMPCRGAYLQIVEIGAGGMTIRIFSSNRTIETIRNSLVLAAFDNNLLLDVSQAGIASGASGTIRFTVQPYFGEVEIYAAFGGAAVTAAGTRYVVGLGGANNRNIALDGTGGSSALQNNNNIVNVQRMAVWGKQLHFQPVNTSAGIATMSVMVTPISQQPA
jgi:hypothetical protein